MSSVGEFQTITYDMPEPGVGRITMNRPAVRNAQSRRMTYELNDAFTAAAFDDEVTVIVLAAEGPHFSSGHDLRDREDYSRAPVGIAGNPAKPGAEGHMALEDELFLNMCRRWQQLPKPTIAQVQGKVIAGGLMLMWVCDLIIASEDASFADITVGFGVNGVEWFAHPWELGTRKAKEMLFTGEPVSVEDAFRLGMVNRVVRREELADVTLAVARSIAQRPSFALRLAKTACNQAADCQGFWNAMQAAFTVQQLAHSHNRELFGVGIDPTHTESVRSARGGSDGRR